MQKNNKIINKYYVSCGSRSSYGLPRWQASLKKKVVLMTEKKPFHLTQGKHVKLGWIAMCSDRLKQREKKSPCFITY